MQDAIRPARSAELRDPGLYRGWATIRGDWDRFYKEFPGLYDRFAVSTLLIADEMQRLADFTRTQVLVLAAGTGKDAFEFARRAERVVAVEPWIEMRSFAIAKQERLGMRNIEFVEGIAEDLSRFADGAFDRLVSIHGMPFPWTDDASVRECLRVVRPGGYALFGGTTGSSTAHTRGAADPTPWDPDGPAMRLLAPYGFEKLVLPVCLDFGSREEALATWGFIYGDAAIDHLIDTPAPVLNVDLVIHCRRS